MLHRADVCLPGRVAQDGYRDAELPARLLGLARPAGEFRLGEGQLGQRVRPGDPFRVALRLGHGRRAGILVAEQPVQLSLP